MSRHTKTPWECVKGRATIGGHGHTVWMLGTAYETEPGTGIGTAIVILPDEDNTPEARAEREATAAFICKAVNAHEALVEALDEAYAELLADDMRDGPRCLLLTTIETALALA